LYGDGLVAAAAALGLALGHIFYISAVNDEVSQWKRPDNATDDQVFSYKYGWAFYAAGSSFIFLMVNIFYSLSTPQPVAQGGIRLKGWVDGHGRRQAIIFKAGRRQPLHGPILPGWIHSGQLILRKISKIGAARMTRC